MKYLYLFQVVSILSVAGSTMVILSSVVFKDMRSKLFMHIIANISFADILGNIEYTMTYRPSNNNWWCSLQGFLNLYGYPCSWLWTTMLMQFLYDLAVHKRVRISIPIAHAICWGIPLVTTLLYLAFIPRGTYERPEGTSTAQLCSYGGDNEEQGFVWHMISYYGLFLLCIVYMLYTYYNIRSDYLTKERAAAGGLPQERETDYPHTQTNTVLARVRMTSESLLLYPLLMVVFWVPHVIGVVLNLVLDSEELIVYGAISTCLKILCGLAMALLFFWKSQAARTLWLRIILCRYNISTTASSTTSSTAGRDSVASNGSCFRDSSFSECDLNSAAGSGWESFLGSESVASSGNGSVAMRVYSVSTVPVFDLGGLSSLRSVSSTTSCNKSIKSDWKNTDTINPIGTDEA